MYKFTMLIYLIDVCNGEMIDVFIGEMSDVFTNILE